MEVNTKMMMVCHRFRSRKYLKKTDHICRRHSHESIDSDKIKIYQAIIYAFRLQESCKVCRRVARDPEATCETGILLRRQPLVPSCNTCEM